MLCESGFEYVLPKTVERLSWKPLCGTDSLVEKL